VAATIYKCLGFPIDTELKASQGRVVAMWITALIRLANCWSEKGSGQPSAQCDRRERAALNDLAWAPLASEKFMFNH